MSACALGTSDQRTEIVRVLNSVGDDDKGLFASLLGDSENLLYRGVLLLRGEGHNSLMICPLGKVIKL